MNILTLRRQIHGSFACAKKTAEVMRLLITTQRHADAASLIEDVHTVGTKLQAAKPIGERSATHQSAFRATLCLYAPAM